jgi:MFS family permease
MMLYFCAALGFLVTGILMVYISRGHFWSMIFYGVMILAALFGIAASCFVNKDPAIESIHDKGKKHHRASEINVMDSCLGLPMIAWMAMGDISFFLGTSGDVVLSYFYLVKQDYLEHAVASVITASFWLLSALIYCGVSSFALRRTKKIFKEEGWHEKPSDVRKVQLTIVVLVVITVAIVVLGIIFGVDSSEDESALVDEGTFAPSEISTGMSTETTTDATLDIQSPMGACNMTMSMFSQSTMALTMAVMSSITAIEVRPLHCPSFSMFVVDR